MAAFCARITGRLAGLRARHESLAGLNLDALTSITKQLFEHRIQFGSSAFIANNFPVLIPGHEAKDEASRPS